MLSILIGSETGQLGGKNLWSHNHSSQIPREGRDLGSFLGLARKSWYKKHVLLQVPEAPRLRFLHKEFGSFRVTEWHSPSPRGSARCSGGTSDARMEDWTEASRPQIYSLTGTQKGPDRLSSGEECRTPNPTSAKVQGCSNLTLKEDGP